MIAPRSSFTPRSVLVLAVACALSSPLALPALRAESAEHADAQSAAIAAMRTWLADIDAGRYEDSWKNASSSFKDKVGSDTWQRQLTQVRTPLGDCSQRELASSVLQESISTPSAPIKGPFVIAQFHSSFAHLESARETVTFIKEADGHWRAAGYYIAPR